MNRDDRAKFQRYEVKLDKFDKKIDDIMDRVDHIHDLIVGEPPDSKGIFQRLDETNGKVKLHQKLIIGIILFLLGVVLTIAGLNPSLASYLLPF